MKTDLPANTIYPLLALIIGAKMVKLLPHFLRNPEDLVMFPAYLLFGYYHPFVKVWAGIAWYDIAWSGRIAGDLAGVNLRDNEITWVAPLDAMARLGLKGENVPSRSPAMPLSYHIWHPLPVGRRASPMALAARSSVYESLQASHGTSFGFNFAPPGLESFRHFQSLPTSNYFVQPMPQAPSCSHVSTVSSSLTSASERQQNRASPAGAPRVRQAGLRSSSGRSTTESSNS